MIYSIIYYYSSANNAAYALAIAYVDEDTALFSFSRFQLAFININQCNDATSSVRHF